MPSEKILQGKKELVNELTAKLQNAASGVLVEYKGINVIDDTQLRREMRKAGVEYFVTKNTMTRFAAKNAGLDGLCSVLEGTTALAISKDIVAPAKVVTEFAKKHENYKIKMGFVEGKVINAKEVSDLADLPPKEVLIAKVLGGFNAPISGFANVLNANLRGLVVALNAIAEKKA